MKKLLVVLILSILPQTVFAQARITGQTRLPVSCSTGQVPAYSTVTNVWSCTTISLSSITDTTNSGSGSLTGAAFTVNQTWNTSGAPTGAVSIAITDTASSGTFGVNYAFSIKGGASATTRLFGITGDKVMYAGVNIIDMRSGFEFIQGGANVGGITSSGPYWNFGNCGAASSAQLVRVCGSGTPAAMISLNVVQASGQTGNMVNFTASAAGDLGKLTKDGFWTSVSIAPKVTTVAALPATPVEGMICAVSDATVTTVNTTVTGGGSNHVMVFYNGTNWLIK